MVLAAAGKEMVDTVVGEAENEIKARDLVDPEEAEIAMQSTTPRVAESGISREPNPGISQIGMETKNL